MALLSVRAAAERLGVSTALLYALCAARRIRHERHGLGRGRIKIPEEALDEYRLAQTVEARGERPRSISPPPQPQRPRLRHLQT